MFDIYEKYLQNLSSIKLINILIHIEYINILLILIKLFFIHNLIKSTIGIHTPI